MVNIVDFEEEISPKRRVNKRAAGNSERESMLLSTFKTDEPNLKFHPKPITSQSVLEKTGSN